MDSFSTNITITILFLIVLLVFFVFEILSKKPSNSRNDYYDNNDQSYDRTEELQERRLRSQYWYKLEAIYDKQSTSTLQNAKTILEDMEKYKNRQSFTNGNIHDIDMWYLKLAKLRELLNYPIWVDDDTDINKYEMPLYTDLDIKYISELIEERQLKEKRY